MSVASTNARLFTSSQLCRRRSAARGRFDSLIVFDNDFALMGPDFSQTSH